MLPVAVGAAAALVGAVYASLQDDEYGHQVVLAGAHDGRVNVRDNRDLANETARDLLGSEDATSQGNDAVSVELDTRLNAFLDITVTAQDPDRAESTANQLASTILEIRTDVSQRRFIDKIAEDTDSIGQLEVQLAEAHSQLEVLADGSTESIETQRLAVSLSDSIEIHRRSVRQAENSLESENPPVAVARSFGLGKVAPDPKQAAAIAGAVAAVCSLILTLLIRRPD